MLSHISGIRHYKRKVDKDGKDDSKENQNTSDSKISTRKKNDDKDKSKDKNKQNESEFDAEEYYLQKKFKSVEESLKLFQDDELFNKPGKVMPNYNYSIMMTYQIKNERATKLNS